MYTEQTIFTSKEQFIQPLVSYIRNTGGFDFWVLNKTYLEIYHFRCTQISDFDVMIDLNNSLEREHIYSGTFVIHMKSNILELLNQVPGKVYTHKLDCYRELYYSLIEKISITKSKKLTVEFTMKVEFLETEFPELLI